MRIFDPKNKRALKKILIMLTPFEAQELMGTLESLNETNDHIHINDDQFMREITVGLYTQENLQNFSDEVIRLLQEDE
jgi:hypothetical protein